MPQTHETIKAACIEGFLSLDAELRGLPAVISGEDRSGCTVVGCFITPKFIVVPNLGDCRCVLATDNTFVPLSRDHKPYNLEEQTRIVRAGGIVSMNRVNGDLAVSRALGDYQYKDNKMLRPTDQLVSPQPEVFRKHVRTARDEFLVMACDGVWDVASNKAVVDFVRMKLRIGETLQRTCTELLDRCLKLGSRDNMTFIVVLLQAGNTAHDGDGKIDVFYE